MSTSRPTWIVCCKLHHFHQLHILVKFPAWIWTRNITIPLLNIRKKTICDSKMWHWKRAEITVISLHSVLSLRLNVSKDFTIRNITHLYFVPLHNEDFMILPYKCQTHVPLLSLTHLACIYFPFWLFWHWISKDNLFPTGKSTPTVLISKRKTSSFAQGRVWKEREKMCLSYGWASYRLISHQ